MADAKNEALKDRLVTVAVPYKVRVSDEEKIYRKLLTGLGARNDLHIAPHALRAAAMVAVLSRLKPHENLGLVEKMKLYDGEEVGEWKLAQIPEIKRAADHEGMTGLGPRAIVDVLSGAASKAGEAHQTGKYLTPIKALIALTDYIERLEAPRDPRAAASVRDRRTQGPPSGSPAPQRSRLRLARSRSSSVEETDRSCRSVVELIASLQCSGSQVPGQVRGTTGERMPTEASSAGTRPAGHARGSSADGGAAGALIGQALARPVKRCRRGR